MNERNAVDGGKYHARVGSFDLPLRADGDKRPSIHVQLVGRFQITGPDGSILRPKTRKARAALALLAHAAPHPVSRARVISLLWSQRAREQALGSLRQTVQELLRLFEPLAFTPLQITRTDLRLLPDLVRVDTAEIVDAALSDFAVLDLMDGALLGDLDDVDPAFDAWLLKARNRFARTARGIGERLLSFCQEPADVIAIGDKLLRLDRAYEPFWRALIAAHAECGDTSQALLLVKRCETVQTEIAATPSDDLLVLIEHVRANPQAAAAPPAPALRPNRVTATLGVLPLLALGHAEPELAFAVGEAIISALAGFRSIGLVPVSAGSDTPLPQLHAAVSEPHTALDWVLEGSIQRAGARVRVTLRLLDRRRGGELAWVQRVERDFDDLLQLQDDIAAEVAAQLDTRLLFLEAQHNQYRDRADAYSLLMPAIPSIYQLDQQRYLAAGDALADATRMAPEFAAAFAWWAYWHVFLVGQGWSNDPVGATARAGELAQRAVMLDPLDARALALAGHVQGFLHRSHTHGGVLLDRALALNPYLPIAWVSSGLNRGYAGDHAEAIRRINRGRHLSPTDPHGFFFDAALMLPTLLAGDFAKVVGIGERVGDLNPRLSTAHKLRLSALGHLGRRDEAARLRDVLGALEPNFNLRDARGLSPISRQADRDLYVEGLRLAGAG